MAAISAIVGLAGTIVSAAGTIAAGKAQEAQAKAQAEMQRRQAVEESARFQREGIKARKERDLVASRQRAVASASGFDPSDPSSSSSWENIWNAGTEAGQNFSYMGEVGKSLGLYQGDLTEWSGKRAAAASKASAFGTLLGGFGSFASDMGNAGWFKPQTASASYNFFGNRSIGGAGYGTDPWSRGVGRTSAPAGWY